jgi:hypothetical protein
MHEDSAGDNTDWIVLWFLCDFHWIIKKNLRLPSSKGYSLV